LHLLFLGGLQLAYTPQVRPPSYRVRLEPLPALKYSEPPLLAPSRLPLPVFSPEETAGLRDQRRLARRPRVFFEEWPDPLISGIGWVGDLIDYLGEEWILPELRGRFQAGERAG
jgi:hypothetical protein